MGKVKEHMLSDAPCIYCDELYNVRRSRLGYEMCMECGEREAKKVKQEKNDENAK